MIPIEKPFRSDAKVAKLGSNENRSHEGRELKWERSFEFWTMSEKIISLDLIAVPLATRAAF
tara:strand:+ start:478 stop:663 length:186 start_codon:yes stop_codon:yes gene_type:complete